ncbi:MAG TPA: hypothetical protein VHF58_01150 [Solirubrobacterales bacterium]|nr:hypothetical protein [Solirubrobacterales bacterium]
MEGESPQPEGEVAPDRRRLLLALGALVAFGAVVTLVAVTAGGSDESSAAAAAPAECVDAWNADRDAVAFARHNSIFHNYTSAQVGYLTPSPDASVSSDPGAGDCVVVFPRNQLDPEPHVAGQILDDGVWSPLIRVTDVNTVARLQSEAFDGANAEPTIDGEIVAD